MLDVTTFVLGVMAMANSSVPDALPMVTPNAGTFNMECLFLGLNPSRLINVDELRRKMMPGRRYQCHPSEF